jgi:hypothetical protein
MSLTTSNFIQDANCYDPRSADIRGLIAGLPFAEVEKVINLSVRNGFYNGKSTQGAIPDILHMLYQVGGDFERYADLAMEYRWNWLTSDSTILQRTKTALDAAEQDLDDILTFTLTREPEVGEKMTLQFLCRVGSQAHFGVYQRCPVGQLLRRVSAKAVALMLAADCSDCSDLLVFESYLLRIKSSINDAQLGGAQFEPGFSENINSLIAIAQRA